MKIYKNKAFSLLISALFLINYIFLPVFAAKQGRIEYNTGLFDYSKLDETIIKKEADEYFNLFLKTENKRHREKYLDIALNRYYLLTKINPSNITYYVQTARIYDTKNKSRLAKEYFSTAYNINSQNPFTNFYFGEYYFKRRDYKKALYFYNKAYNNGYNNNYELNLRLAVIYEKLADLVNAKKFYEISYSLKRDSSLQEKIQLLNELNYEKSEYYNTIRE